MNAPVFGDKQAIRRIDPFRVVLDDGIDVPPTVLGCPECDSPVHVEFDDTWIQGNDFGAGSLLWYCKDKPFIHDFDYRMQDDVMQDENKIVAYIQEKYPTFRNEC